MRWFWVDRFEEFVSGTRARSIKSVALCEEQLDDYCAAWPYMPQPLMIEGLAQTGGLLLGQMSDFKAKIVLAKVGKATFHHFARPGDKLTYSVELLSIQADGAIAAGNIELNGDTLGTAELVFAALDGSEFENVELFEPHRFLRMMRLMRLFEVGVNPDGSRIKIPQHMLDAEQELFASQNS